MLTKSFLNCVRGLSYWSTHDVCPFRDNNQSTWAVVMAQLVDRLLPIPEVRSSNPVIGKNLYWTFYSQLYWKDENKEKEAGKGPFKKTISQPVAVRFKSIKVKVDHKRYLNRVVGVSDRLLMTRVALFKCNWDCGIDILEGTFYKSSIQVDKYHTAPLSGHCKVFGAHSPTLLFTAKPKLLCSNLIETLPR